MIKKRYKTAKQLGGVIDLERLRSGPSKCIERVPALFFDLTYPSEDLQVMLRALCSRFSGGEGEGIPTALRGSLSGSGDLAAQIDIRIPGPMDKARAEGLCESLPDLSGSTYVAKFKVVKRENGLDREG